MPIKAPTTLIEVEVTEKDALLLKSKQELAAMISAVDAQLATLQGSRRKLMTLLNFKAAFEPAPVVEAPVE